MKGERTSQVANGWGGASVVEGSSGGGALASGASAMYSSICARARGRAKGYGALAGCTQRRLTRSLMENGSVSEGEWVLQVSQRKCRRCKKEKSTSEFNVSRNGESTLNCSDCCLKLATYMSKHSKTEKGKETRRRHERGPKGKATKKRYKESELGMATYDAYNSSNRRKELRAQEYERIHSDPGRHIEHAIGVTISRMIRGQAQSSQKVTALTDFQNRDSLLEHFESQFEPGMTMQNHGKLILGEERRWNVGHRIARVLYDPSNPEDQRRCWMRMNLFPQWADENISAKATLPPLQELLRLKNCWPTGWGEELPEGV